jgi:hypothetical protein
MAKTSEAQLPAVINTTTKQYSNTLGSKMNKLTCQLGFWSATLNTFLALTINAGMIASAVLFPMTAITTAESYANTFNSLQMLPFIPSLLLAPIFVVMILCIHHHTSHDKKILSQLSVSFALICAGILSIHYYIQLTIVQQNMLNNAAQQVWQYAAPNPHSFFWTFAALGYGFMGISMLFAAPTFQEKSDRTIKWLFTANAIVGIGFITGNALGIFTINIVASFTWGTLFPIAIILLARRFQKKLDQF